MRRGGYYIAGTRMSLDSIIYPFKNGASPESILRSFPLIGSLERVYEAITFYLANKDKLLRPIFWNRSGCLRSWRPNNHRSPKASPRN